MMRFTWLVLFVNLATAQQPEVKNLVFEGAGIRGIAYAGAIEVLEEKDMLKKIERVGGTSAGAITAMLLSIGYNAEEITKIVSSTSFKKFNDGRFFFVGGINRMNKYYGWYRGKQFEKWLDKLIIAKTGNANINFGEMQAKGYKDLYVTGTSLNKQQTIIFSKEKYPDMRIRDAVRISMSIPFYFEAVFVDSTGKILDHPKDRNNVDVMVDGGFTANFPIFLFDSSRYQYPGTNTPVKNKETIGFRIDSKEQIEYDSLGKGLAPMRISNVSEYTRAFYAMLIENLNRQALTAEDWARTVSIDDGDIQPRIKKLSEEEVTKLIQNGRAATEKFFAAK
jgi:NTE family protein